MIIGIDLDTKRITLACRVAGEWTRAIVHPDSASDLTETLAAIIEARDKTGAEWPVAYIEAPYLGPNAKTFGLLSRVYGRIEHACAALDIRVVETAPKQWHSVLAVNRWLPITRKDVKASSMRCATQVEMVKGKLTEHEADAICIAVYGEMAERMLAATDGPWRLKEAPKGRKKRA